MPEISSTVGSAAISSLSGRVGELVNVLWDFSFGLLVSLIHLPRNAEELTERMKRLEDLKDDLRGRAEEQVANQLQLEVTHQVSGWIDRVEKLRSKVDNFDASFDCKSICFTGFCVGYNAVQLLRQVDVLMEEGNSMSKLPPNELVCRRRPDAVEEVRSETSSSSIVDRNETLRQIQGHISENGVGIIGIYGMGGVGKTTLLQIINNEFLQGEGRGLFDIAIWVTVSKDVKILEIQKTIVDRLGLPDDKEKRDIPQEQQAKRLFSELSKKRFILLLDDVWVKLDLVKIGIPLPKNVKINCKILFTTRSIGVCNAMVTDRRVEVGMLDDDRSWELFQSKLSTEAVKAVVDDPDIRQLAGQVVARCGGLPISLITVRSAMANATTLYEWRHAKNALDRCATEISGVEDMLASLKFSYDMLKDDTLRSCLLYCGLFPEDSNIHKGQIIDYWVCEGFLDPEDGQDSHIDDTRDRGHRRIRELQNACLLEEGNIGWKGEQTVRLHDTVLDMVQWITKQDFVVLSGSTNTARVPQPRRWETAKRISLRGRNWTEALPSEKLNCPNLTTLLLDLPSEDTKGFFEFMSPALRVLVLRGFSFKKIPMQITSLVQLQYLDLSWTKTTSLPTELGDLVNLRQLELRYTSSLRSIPREAISRLTRLQVLNLEESGYDFSRETRHRQLGLSDLEKLPRLCELSLPVSSWPSLQKIADSNKLRESVRYMDLWLDSGFPSGDIMTEKIGNLSRLRELKIYGDPENPLPGELRFSPDHLQGGSLLPRLRHLYFNGVSGFTELTWVGQLPGLETIDIADCHGVTELLLLHGAGLPHDGSTPPFPKLKTMTLRVLPALRRISTCPLDFPSLEEICVMACPHLKQLPFGPEGAKKIRRIKGDQEWWDGLEWDNYPDGTNKFLPYFKAWGR